MNAAELNQSDAWLEGLGRPPPVEVDLAPTADPKKAFAEELKKVPFAWAAQRGSQELFIRSPFFETLYEGTRGPGKTDALLMDFAQHVTQPGVKGFGAAWKGILFRRTFPELADVISKSKKWFYSMPHLGGKYNEAKYQWEFPHGEILLLRHFMRVDDYWSYHGHEYPWIGWEELCTWPDLGGYRRMMSCCRSSNPDVPRKYRATTNPFGPGHNVVKARFQLPAMRFKPIIGSIDPASGLVEPPRLAIFGKLDENKILLAADPDYKQRLAGSARSKAELKAWLYGDWDIVAGGMFDDIWDPRYHVVPRFDIPKSWKITRSFDWGSSAPFSVGWWAESDGCDVLVNGKWRSTLRGDRFRIAEWYGCRPGVPNEGLRLLGVEVAKGIVEREIGMKILGRVHPGPADSRIFSTENGMCIANDMAKPVMVDGKQYAGVTFSTAENKPFSRANGWEMLRKWMKNALPPVTKGPREKPGVFFLDLCTDCINLLPVLPRDEKKPDDIDTDAEDHIADEIRYMILSIGGEFKSSQAIGAW